MAITLTTNTTQDRRLRQQESADVSTPTLAQMDMADRWVLIDDLLGGTEAMRAKSKVWLPKEPREEAKDYSLRVERSFLYEIFGDTVDKLAAKPFEQPVTVPDDPLPPLIQPLLDEDVDMEGTSLTSFSRQAFEHGTTYGIAHAIVEAPVNPDRSATLDKRPYFVLIHPRDFLGGRYRKNGNGLYELADIRFLVETSVPLGEWGETLEKVVRVMTTTTTQDFVLTDDEDYQPIDEPRPHGFNSYSPEGGSIPYAPLYFNKRGRLYATPPLEKLAWLNLEHWQKASDHSNLIRFASVGTMMITGMSDDQVEEGFTVGPRNHLLFTNENAKGFVVEHSGKAIGTLEAHLLRLEERAEVMGLEPFMRKTGSETATGKKMHGDKSNSAIKRWIRNEEDWLVKLFEMAATWMSKSSGDIASTQLPEGWRPKIYDDFKTPILAGSDDVDKLLKMRQGGAPQISHETFISENKRRGFLAEEVNADDEEEMIAKEAAAAPPAYGDLPPEAELIEPENEEGAEE